MARGFESKSVADQQETAQVDSLPAESGQRDPTQRDPARLARLRVLELSRADVQHRLEHAQAAGHREVLLRALEALEAEIRRLG
jgi:hypothetical protein